MREPKFTKGPWCLDGFCLTTVLKKVRDKSDPEAKHLCGDYDEIGRFKKIEDARLASIAPDLYAEADRARLALVIAAGFVERLEPEHATAMRRQAAELAKVLAKACGES